MPLALVLEYEHKFWRSNTSQSQRENVTFEILSDLHSFQAGSAGLSFCTLSLQCAQSIHTRHMCTYVLAYVCTCVCVCGASIAIAKGLHMSLLCPSTSIDSEHELISRTQTAYPDHPANRPTGHPATGAGLAATSPCCLDCRKLRPCHAFASIHYPLVAEWPDNSVWRFGSLQICRVRMLSQMFGVPKCTRCTLAGREKERG